MTPIIRNTDIVILGSGGAGMYAAIIVGRAGLNSVLLDRCRIGRGGATIMAQMTVAAAIAEEEPDSWQDHMRDTLLAGHQLCDENLAMLLCEHAPSVMRQMDEWRVGWARGGDGRIRQIRAPGHGAARCMYVDILDTGPSVSASLRRQVAKQAQIRRMANVVVTDLWIEDGVARGAIGFDLITGTRVNIAARAVILATGGLTRLFARNSASDTMAGEGHYMALRAGARLIDMEFVQFFPIGHLAPRLVGMDPIMWDPFRYKLGGRLLNGKGEEFIERYGGQDGGVYRAQRDVVTYAIDQEIAAGRGSPQGGVFLSFTHLGAQHLEEAFGPVIGRLAENGIDLTRQPVEVAPIAHYHMGGVAADRGLQTDIEGLFVAGEIVAGANGANRLSGNAITEALVFGAVCGEAAANYAKRTQAAEWVDCPATSRAGERQDRVLRGGRGGNVAQSYRELQELLWRGLGPLRDRGRLIEIIKQCRAWRSDLGGLLPAPVASYHYSAAEWFQLEAGLYLGEAMARAALLREESRGAHQRKDFPETRSEYRRSMAVYLSGDELVVDGRPTDTKRQ